MKNTNIAVAAATGLALLLFAGCGERGGAKEYGRAMQAWKAGDLVRARSLLEKSIRKTAAGDKKSAALNQLGIVLWNLGEAQLAAEAFGQSCGLAEGISGAHLNQGIALFQAGRHDEAEVALNNFLGENPDSRTARTMLGMVEMRRRNWAGAVQEISPVVTADPRDPAAQNALALAELHQARNSDGAVRRLRQVLAAHPGYAPAAYNLAIIHEQWLGDKTAAAEAYGAYLQKAGADGFRAEAARQALARLGGAAAAPAPNPDAALRLVADGSRLHAEKKYAEAVETYRQALLADPSQKTAHYNMGLALYAQGKYPEAAQACEAALRLDPRFADARYMLALALFQQRRWDDAEREARMLRQIDAERGAAMLKHIADARK